MIKRYESLVFSTAPNFGKHILIKKNPIKPNYNLFLAKHQEVLSYLDNLLVFWNELDWLSSRDPPLLVLSERLTENSKRRK